MPRAHLEWYWDEVTRLLQPAVDRSAGRMTMEKLREQLEAKDQQLYIALDEFQIVVGAWTSHIAVLCDGSKVLELLYCGGTNIQLWLDAGLNAMEDWAREEKCGSVTIVGRLGWGRLVKHRDYHHFATVIEKVLDYG